MALVDHRFIIELERSDSGVGCVVIRLGGDHTVAAPGPEVIRLPFPGGHDSAALLKGALTAALQYTDALVDSNEAYCRASGDEPDEIPADATSIEHHGATIYTWYSPGRPADSRWTAVADGFAWRCGSTEQGARNNLIAEMGAF